MAERKPLSKKIRFEVFKRDKFTCQYCGRMAPEVVLHIDHIKPVAEGGGNDIMNLVTACSDCNLGKGKRELSDDSVIMKQKRMLDELEERKQQLEMMMEWKNGNLEIENQKIHELGLYFSRFCRTRSVLTPLLVEELKLAIKKYSIDDICYAIEVAAERYYSPGDNGRHATKMIRRICANKEMERENPVKHYTNYAFNLLKKRFGYAYDDDYDIGIDADYIVGFMEYNTEERFKLFQKAVWEEYDGGDNPTAGLFEKLWAIKERGYR